MYKVGILSKIILCYIFCFLLFLSYIRLYILYNIIYYVINYAMDALCYIFLFAITLLPFHSLFELLFLWGFCVRPPALELYEWRTHPKWVPQL